MMGYLCELAMRLQSISRAQKNRSIFGRNRSPGRAASGPQRKSFYLRVEADYPLRLVLLKERAAKSSTGIASIVFFSIRLIMVFDLATISFDQGSPGTESSGSVGR
jgi:hypothetical protein